MATKPAAKPNLKPVEVAPVEAVEEAPKKRSKLPLILIALVLVLGGGGFAAYHFLLAPSGKTKEPAKVAVSKPTFMTLEPFTVNLKGGEHFLQLGMVVQLDDEKTSDDIKAALPQIRNDILLLLTSKTPEDLESQEGKQKLAGEVLAATKKPLAPEAAAHVQSVLFASMVIQ